MARPRYLLTGDYHHIYFRGIDGAQIFRDEHDRQSFLRYWAKYSEGLAVETVVWALLSTHGHYFLAGPIEHVSLLLHRVLGTYARSYNSRWGRSGDLFDGRFRSKPIRDSDHARIVVRYILRNPVEAGLCRLDALPTYRWTSLCELLNKNGGWVHRKNCALRSLFSLAEDNIGRQVWSWVVAENESLTESRILYEVCASHFVRGQEVRSASKSPAAVAAREILARRLRNELEWSSREISRYLRCSRRSVRRFVAAAPTSAQHAVNCGLSRTDR